MKELAFSSARNLAAAIRRRRLKSRDLIESYLARIERFNPAINAVVTLDADGARRRARTESSDPGIPPPAGARRRP